MIIGRIHFCEQINNLHMRQRNWWCQMWKYDWVTTYPDPGYKHCSKTSDLSYL